MSLILDCKYGDLLFCSEFAFLAGIYASFKAGLVSPDTIVGLMNKYELTARFSHIIANNPNVVLLKQINCRLACLLLLLQPIN